MAKGSSSDNSLTEKKTHPRAIPDIVALDFKFLLANTSKRGKLEGGDRRKVKRSKKVKRDFEKPSCSVSPELIPHNKSCAQSHAVLIDLQSLLCCSLHLGWSCRSLSQESFTNNQKLKAFACKDLTFVI